MIITVDTETGETAVTAHPGMPALPGRTIDQVSAKWLMLISGPVRRPDPSVSDLIRAGWARADAAGGALVYPPDGGPDR